MKQTSSLTEGRIFPSLIKFALPVLFALFLQSLYGGVDLLIVGQFASTADISGVATGSMLMHTFTMIITGLAMGITILVGQKIGEKNEKEAEKAIGTGIVLFGFVALLLTIILGLFAQVFTTLLHAPVEAEAATTIYIRVCGLGSIFIIAYNVLGAIFRGLGDSKTPLLTVMIACGLNIIGDLIFVAIFGLGALGAALATVISQGISVWISLLIIKKKTLPFTFSKRSIRLDKRVVARELRLGIPIALQEFLVGMSFLVIQAIVNSIGLDESAGVGVAEKVCGFIMLVPSAFMQAMAAFVAQNLGAGKPERNKKALLYGIETSFLVGIVMFWVTFFHGDLLAGLFAKEAVVIGFAHEYLKAYAIDTLLTAELFCFIGYLNGCGATFFVMCQGLAGALLIRVPVSFLMSQLENTSLFKIGLATPCATVVQILLCIVCFIVVEKKLRALESA